MSLSLSYIRQTNKCCRLPPMLSPRDNDMEQLKRNIHVIKHSSRVCIRVYVRWVLVFRAVATGCLECTSFLHTCYEGIAFILINTSTVITIFHFETNYILLRYRLNCIYILYYYFLKTKFINISNQIKGECFEYFIFLLNKSVNYSKV